MSRLGVHLHIKVIFFWPPRALSQMRSMVDDIMVHETAIHVSRVGVVFRSFIVSDIYQCPVNRDLEGSSLLAHKTNQINKGTFKQFFLFIGDLFYIQD